MTRPDTQAFGELLDLLRDAEKQFLSRNQTADVEIAENYGHILNLVSMAIDFYMLNDWERPRFVPVVTQYRKLGGDNAHALYDFAPVLGDRSYLMRGNRGKTAYLGFTIYGGESEAAVHVCANTNSSEIQFEPDGSFAIVLSPHEVDDRARNHIRLAPESNSFVIRQYFHNDRKEGRATYTIEPLDPVGKPPAASGESTARRLRSMIEVIRGWVNLSPIAYPEEDAAYNAVCAPFKTGESTGHWSTPDNLHAFGFYRLRPGEALVLRGRSPECLYWSCHLWNACMQSFDYLNYQCAICKEQVQLEPDGSWRLVISPDDPKVANWLDTCGHERGFIYFRWLQAADLPPAIEYEVVPTASLAR